MKGSRSRKPKDDLGPSSTPPPAAEAAAAEKPKVAAPPAPGLRCPFCKAELANGALAAACAACGTLHHPACFAEHHGCSTHGCDSTRGLSVVVGAPPLPPFAPLRCAVCGKDCPADVIVARCGCGRVLHTACYEQLKRCGPSPCTGRVELLPHADAVKDLLRERSWLIARVGLVMAGLSALGGCGVWLRLASRWPGPEVAVLAVALVVLLFLGSLALLHQSLGLRRRAQAIGAHPPRPPSRAEDTLKQLERTLEDL